MKIVFSTWLIPFLYQFSTSTRKIIASVQPASPSEHSSCDHIHCVLEIFPSILSCSYYQYYLENSHVQNSVKVTQGESFVKGPRPR